MKILYFHEYFATRDSAVATRSYEIAHRLVQRGHSVTVVSRETRAGRPAEGGRRRLVSRETVDGIDVVSISVPYSQSFSTALRIASFLTFMVAACLVGLGLPRPDVVFASSTPLTIGVPGVLVSRTKRVPFVFEIRDLWPAAPVALGMLRQPQLIAAAEALEALLYRAAERVVVLSEASRDALLARGVPAAKLVFAPNAADLDLFRPDNLDAGFRPAHGLEGHFVALYAGAMGRLNGLDQLLDAAALLHESSYRNVIFVVVGDGSERPRLMRRKLGDGLHNVLFLDPMPKTQLAGVVGAVDVTLTLFAPHPVLETNCPNKLFDSLAAGKPVVENLDGWLRRSVEGGGAGVYVRAGDGAELAATLAALAVEPELVAAMGRRARRLAECDFARDLMACRVVDALEQAAGWAA